MVLATLEGSLRLLNSQCHGSGESRRKLERGLMPDAQVPADARRAPSSAIHFLLRDDAGCLRLTAHHQSLSSSKNARFDVSGMSLTSGQGRMHTNRGTNSKRKIIHEKTHTVLSKLSQPEGQASHSKRKDTGLQMAAPFPIPAVLSLLSLLSQSSTVRESLKFSRHCEHSEGCEHCEHSRIKRHCPSRHCGSPSVSWPKCLLDMWKNPH